MLRCRFPHRIWNWIRPEGARFYDRTGKLLIEAGSMRARDGIWYGAVDAPEEECILPAFLAARNLSMQDVQAPDLLGGPRAVANALAGADDLAGDAAAELLAMRGVESGVWEKARLAGALAARYGRLRLAEWIINVRLYGRGTAGVDDAALTHFGIHADALTDSQCAALEALAQDPGLGEEEAEWKTARNAILNRMVNKGFLEKAKWEHAIAAPILPGVAAGAKRCILGIAFLPRRRMLCLPDTIPPYRRRILAEMGTGLRSTISTSSEADVQKVRPVMQW